MVTTSTLRAQLSGGVGNLELHVELDASAGALVLVGPNGAGKTSSLLMLLGVLRPTGGRIELSGRVLFDAAARVNVPVEQRQIAYVPQDYALFPHLTVRQNVAFGPESTSLGERPQARLERVEALLSELGLLALAERCTTTLSGGEKQRVALARALAVRPRALLLDEPLAALDVAARRQVRGVLGAYLDKLSLPTIVVTHAAADARALGRRFAVLEAGGIVQTGSWAELAAEPASPFVRELVASGE